MKLTPLFIGMVVFASIMLGWGVIFGSVQRVYSPGGEANATVFATFNNTFTRIDNAMAGIEEDTVGAATKSVLDWTKYQDILFVFVKVGGTLLQLPDITLTFIGDAFSFVAIPKELYWVSRMVFLIVTVITVMRVAAIFTKTQEEI